MCGCIWNASQIEAGLGLGHHTVDSYLDYLEGACLIRCLPPYSANLGKRLVKSPKEYGRDSGLLHRLLGNPSLSRSHGRDLAGIFELPPNRTILHARL